MSDTPDVQVSVDTPEESPKPHELDHERRLTQLEGDTAPREHMHMEYAPADHEHGDYARSDHQHPEYVRLEELPGRVRDELANITPVEPENHSPDEVEIVEETPAEDDNDEPERQTIRVRRHGKWETREI